VAALRYHGELLGARKYDGSSPGERERAKEEERERESTSISRSPSSLRSRTRFSYSLSLDPSFLFLFFDRFHFRPVRREILPRRRLTVAAFEIVASRLFSPSDVYLRGRTDLPSVGSVTDRRQGVVIRSVVKFHHCPRAAWNRLDSSLPCR